MERETVKMKKAEYMAGLVGQTFEGVISGVTGWGLYVELPNTVEGLVHVNSMKDYYRFDEENYQLVESTMALCSIWATRCGVQVAGADVQTRSVDFILEEDALIPEGGSPDGQTSGKASGGGPDGRGRKGGRSSREEKAMAKEKGSRLIANNKKAYHDYFIEETYEAGIALHGTEVKSLRMGKCSVKESFIRIENDEVYIYGMHISPYEKGNIFNKDPLRVKKLLLHKSEIRKLREKSRKRVIRWCR